LKRSKDETNGIEARFRPPGFDLGALLVIRKIGDPFHDNPYRFGFLACCQQADAFHLATYVAAGAGTPRDSSQQLSQVKLTADARTARQDASEVGRKIVLALTALPLEQVEKRLLREEPLSFLVVDDVAIGLALLPSDMRDNAIVIRKYPFRNEDMSVLLCLAVDPKRHTDLDDGCRRTRGPKDNSL